MTLGLAEHEMEAQQVPNAAPEPVSSGGVRGVLNRVWRQYNAAVWALVGSHVRTSLFDPHFLYRYYFLKNLRRVTYDRTGILVDIGCGRQPYQSLLPAAMRVGIDLPYYSGGDPAAQPVVACYGHAASLPLRDRVAQTAVAFQVLEHVPEPLPILQEAYRVLVPGGRLLVTVPQSFPMHGIPHDYYRYTQYGITWLLEQAHFRVLSVEPNGTFGAYIGLMWNIYMFQHCFESREPYALRLFLGAVKMVLTPILLLIVALVNLWGVVLEAWHHLPYFTANWTVVAVKPHERSE